MKCDYGKWALWGSLLSWVMLIAFVVLGWWALSLEIHAHHGPADPPRSTPMMKASHSLILLSYPMSIACMVLAALGVAKERSVASAVIGGFIALVLFAFLSFAMWAGRNF